MEQVEIEDQLSSTIDNEEILAEGSSASSKPTGIFSQEGVVTLGEGSFDHDVIKKNFIMGMGSLAKDTEVVGIYKNMNTSIRNRARVETFRIFSQAVASNCGGSANIRQAWYGASKDEISEILTHGFSRLRSPADGQCHGFGVHLYPARFSIDGALTSVEDENGLRHVLSCQVILGKSEVINAGSKMYHPSSKDFDSGVDNLVEPRRYIIWSSYMNSHILPTYIISFKASCLRESASNFRHGRGNQLIRPISSLVKFSRLLSILERHLPPWKKNLITKCHNEFLKKKITRQQVIQRIRQIAGDDLLHMIIKMF